MEDPLHSNEILEIRWHGRGGQGAVTAAIAVAKAAVEVGKYATASPEFGAERRGAPVRAYNRVSTKPIRARTPILEPDIVVVLDSSLPPEMYLEGIKDGGLLLINTKRSIDEVRRILGNPNIKIAVVDATGIALKTLGIPIVNTAMLGAFAKLVNIADLSVFESIIYDLVPERFISSNINSIRIAYNSVVVKDE
ncbi:MAG: 2-oxoacid:acceptor oxidoreductase family protein [Desulfurococcales archaeon]|nr:2-oxoacid:acceptor oxidoreductase family protein [Desulfurococcales archaeon]